MAKCSMRLITLGLLGACSLFSDDGLPNGVWGGPQIEVTTSGAGIEINHWCYDVSFPAPAHLARGDSFSVSGSVTRDSWAAEVGQAWRLAGALHGDTLSITYYWAQVGTGVWVGPFREKLAPGHGTFEQDPCPI